MKVLMCIESLDAGGKERRLVELVKGLKSSGIDCQLTLLKNGIHYTDVFETGVNIHVLKRKFAKDLRPFLSFFKLCREYNPDIIHVWGNLAALYAIPAKVLLKIPMLNSQITDAPLAARWSLLENTLPFYFSDLLISNSYAGLRAYEIKNSEGVVIQNGFDFNRISNLEDPRKVRARFHIETDHVVGMVASFSPLKDYNTYLAGAEKVLCTRQDVTFLCIGAGNYSSYLGIIPPKFSDRIKFIRPQAKVESLMNICDVGVLATYTEGIPNAVLEFMALGKAVVVTDGGGTNELVVNGETGFLINSRSPQELAGKVSYLLDHHRERAVMGSEGRRRIQEQFNLDKMIRAFVEVYNGAANRKRNR
jgi:glycosyltransferase involved in cell wall biosynthesis